MPARKRRTRGDQTGRRPDESLQPRTGYAPCPLIRLHSRRAYLRDDMTGGSRQREWPSATRGAPRSPFLGDVPACRIDLWRWICQSGSFSASSFFWRSQIQTGTESRSYHSASRCSLNGDNDRCYQRTSFDHFVEKPFQPPPYLRFDRVAVHGRGALQFVKHL